MMKILKIKVLVCVLIIVTGMVVAQTAVDDCLVKVGTPDTIGPINMHSFYGQIVGFAYLTNRDNPDVFLQNDRWYPEFSKYKCIKRTEKGIPVFGEKEIIKVPSPLNRDKYPVYVFQTKTPDNTHMIWYNADTKKIHYGQYLDSRKEFVEIRSVNCPTTPTTPKSITGYFGEDGRLHIFLGVENVWETRPQNQDISLYRGDGIYQGKFSSTGLYETSFPGWLEGNGTPVKLVSPTNTETLRSYMSLSILKFNLNNKEDVVAGSYFGDLLYYKNTGSNITPQFTHKKYLADHAGNAIRHPSIGATPSVYPNSEGNLSDVIVTGEGGVYYYKFSGNFAFNGNPIYEDPVYVLETDANLFGGSLIVPSVVDWDRDGDLDIVAGNSQGFILFFENVGTDVEPKFLPGIPLHANGDKIWIQGGYGESIQGPVESRWGYTCPNVIDWNHDGYLDIVMGDARGKHTVYMGGSSGLKAERSIYLDDLELRGTWRCRPGVFSVGNETGYITMDDQNELHLYWKVDDYNLEDGRKLLLTNGKAITSTPDPESSGTGRIKFEVVDWDGDGIKDLIMGTNKWMTIPEPIYGIPSNAPSVSRGASVLYLKNVGTDKSPMYENPVALQYDNKPFHFFGHACGPVVTNLGSNSNQKNILVGDERGRFYLLDRKKLSNTTPKYKGVPVEIISEIKFNRRLIRSGYKIYLDSTLNFILENDFFAANMYVQINLKEKQAYQVIPKQDGQVYIATDSEIMPDELQNKWLKIEEGSLKYANSVNVRSFNVFTYSAKKGEIIEIPQIGELGSFLISTSIEEGCVPDPQIPGINVASVLLNTGESITNPSIVALNNFDCFASYEIGNGNDRRAVIIKSNDGGNNWNELSQIDSIYNASLFLNQGKLFLIAATSSSNNTIILYSDNGVKWSRSGPGILAIDWIPLGSPIVKLHNRFWRTAKSTVNNEVCFLSAPVNSDISLRTNWLKSTSVAFPTELGNTNSLIAGAVINSEAGRVLSLWGDENALNGDQAIVVSVDEYGVNASLDTQVLPYLPGAHKYFSIQYDIETSSYWVLSNPKHQSDLQGSIPENRVLNYLAMGISNDLTNLTPRYEVLHHVTPTYYAFQNSNWIFLDNDILILTCVTWPDCTGLPSNIKNPNNLVAYKIKNARLLLTDVQNIGENIKTKVFPNPAQSKITIVYADISKEFLNCKLYSFSGILLLSNRIVNSGDLDVSNLPRGLYVLQIEDDVFYKIQLK